MLFNTGIDKSIYETRRKDLINTIKQNHAKIKDGFVLLFANFEFDRVPFRQESSFYYLTGVTEPAVALTIDLSGKTTLFIPNCAKTRAKWVTNAIQPTKEHAKELGVDEITVLGNACPGYQLHPFFALNMYTHLNKKIEECLKSNGAIFSLSPDNAYQYVEQRLVLERLQKVIPTLDKNIIDISEIVGAMRQSKDMQEIEQLYEAIGITMLAHEAAAQAISNDTTECEVQASLEFIMTGACSTPAFPSIVASGKNGTILHHTQSNKIMKNGELVVVDIGAESNYYCADLSRTYPVSGKFTKRQKELYTIVLQTQEFIADQARPGVWLNNKEKPEQSLHHMAQAFLKEKGYDRFFIHGIGHFLGLDVHDVGNYKEPLKEGDVITIEPGLYLPDEEIGIRIEDNYWIVKGGAVCLSEDLPKSVEEIERMVQQTFDDEPSEIEDLDIYDIEDEEEQVQH